MENKKEHKFGIGDVLRVKDYGSGLCFKEKGKLCIVTELGEYVTNDPGYKILPALEGNPKTGGYNYFVGESSFELVNRCPRVGEYISFDPYFTKNAAFYLSKEDITTIENNYVHRKPFKVKSVQVSLLNTVVITTEELPNCRLVLQAIVNNNQLYLKEGWKNEPSYTTEYVTIKDKNWDWPEKWYIIITKENRDSFKKWYLTKFSDQSCKDFSIGAAYSMDGNYTFTFANRMYNHPEYKEITSEQFKDYVIPYFDLETGVWNKPRFEVSVMDFPVSMEEAFQITKNGALAAMGISKSKGINIPIVKSLNFVPPKVLIKKDITKIQVSVPEFKTETNKQIKILPLKIKV